MKKEDIPSFLVHSSHGLTGAAAAAALFASGVILGGFAGDGETMDAKSTPPPVEKVAETPTPHQAQAPLTTSMPAPAEVHAAPNLAHASEHRPPSPHVSPAPAVRSTHAPTATANARLPGVDVSHWRGAISWLNVALSGVRFAYAKASEGDDFTDPTFTANRDGARAHKIRIGGYFVFDPGADAAMQVNKFLAQNPLQANMLPPGVDIEKAPTGDLLSFQKAVGAVLDELATKTGCIPVIYANISTWTSALQPVLQGRPHYLWISHPTDAQRTPGVTGWTFWQHSFQGHVPGISGGVDLDYFRGSEMDLNRLLIAGDGSGKRCAPLQQ